VPLEYPPNLNDVSLHDFIPKKKGGECGGDKIRGRKRGEKRTYNDLNLITKFNSQ
jgi:hypothetical protein